ncbi:MAG: CGNR zinc finger domain-containing protein [Brevibacterium sp.]|uniref:CGNR zinc finger domain-containing protein n=1 Tax=Brevibacterium sp. TaxID=1701 RepID=UPI00264A1D0A|nr:CGNR zinc finger domain-containing protein [Brevibacterium sp.]MDN5807808.1 CGNR zinc finger domain-containing protein [Brevibacterium sp.]MDN5834470.1 CGNR zinc finger domain-containing protein [Brevibacterium sp.]MDN5877845.1 CGNR zinc finger domain-containing protein [Brevibacterium sp.]MDN5910119.1 CGNR zinc finger domain-containing protein [Brevibacterium sp.]MDN6134530.1 CGNR zinc finger domain-containing protein [Brevibacterium sp.]
MTFANDIRSNLTMLVDLLNTSGAIAEEGDELTTTAGLHGFAARHDFSGPLKATKSDVEETRELRERFAIVLDASIDAETEHEASKATERIVGEVNVTLREAGALPQLVRHGDWDWHLHAVGQFASLADRVAADVALVLIDLIRSGDLDRLGLCAAEDCNAYLADFTRNRSKRFCDSGHCANRTHVAAFRARQTDA